jgi:hypothetical protein
LNDAEGRQGHRCQRTSVSHVAKRHNRAARRNFGSRNKHIAGASELKSVSARPLVLSRVHWVRSELVAKVKFLTWAEDNLLR